MLVGPARSQSHMIARVCEGIPVAIFDSHLWKTAVTVAGAKLYSMSTVVGYSNIEAYRGSLYGVLPLPLVAPEPIDRRVVRGLHQVPSREEYREASFAKG